jgi:NAD(P)-dependent dehydrogenase (short-subunit alcohol dehydrogenase family)
VVRDRLDGPSGSVVAGLGVLVPAHTAESRGVAPGRGRLLGQRILVVGGGTRPSTDEDAPVGNGQAISMLAAREGALVAVADRDRVAADATGRLIATDRDGSRRAIVSVADVTDPGVCDRLIESTVDRLGGVDGVVVNLGLELGGELSGTSIADWDAVLAVNLRAHFAIARAVLPVLTAGGAIVFVGSAARTNAPAHDAAAAALAGLTRSIAMEVAPTRRANLLVAGHIDTPRGRAAAADHVRRTAAVPLGRQGTAWDVAYGAVWLLSGESAFMTGQQLVLDGGLTCR